jgi:hypothetical protein
MGARVPEPVRGTLTLDATGHREDPVLLEPTPIVPQPRRTRTAAVTAVILVTGTLLAVVGVGLLGPHGETAPTPAPVPTEAPGATDVAAVPTTAEDSGDPEAPARSRFGLDPASIETVLAAHEKGADDGTWYVVLGWLSMRPGEFDCRPGATDSAAACAREGILATDPGPVLALVDGRATELGAGAPHLRSVFPPGIAIAPTGTDDAEGTTATGPSADGAIAPRQVVLVGRFGPSSTEDCTHGFLGCSAPFVVDEVR